MEQIIVKKLLNCYCLVQDSEKQRQQSSNQATLHFSFPIMILDVFLMWNIGVLNSVLIYSVGKVALHQISTACLILPWWSSFHYCSMLNWWKRLDQAAHYHFLSP